MFFGQSRLTQSKFDRALENNALLLIALDSEQPVGFKFGYVVGGEPTFFLLVGWGPAGLSPQRDCPGDAAAPGRSCPQFRSEEDLLHYL